VRFDRRVLARRFLPRAMGWVHPYGGARPHDLNINSFLHVSGSRPFTTPDNSDNARLFSLLSFGESWHNNHHAFPGSANFGLGHGWSDPGWWVVLGLARLGLATDLRLPTNQAIDRRLNSRNSS
jgi:stearoyl-CoA desaturase (Delta-9 desaturase)